MRKLSILQSIATISVFVWAGSVSAQNLSEKRLTKLVAKISEDSSKLVKYKSLISPYETEKRELADDAQQSADDNKKAAEQLSRDPQDKRLARKANRSASSARKDAKKARVAADKLDDLNKDIKDLTRQLEKEQIKFQEQQSAKRAINPSGSAGLQAATKDSSLSQK